jgi:hypothetical protein
MALIGFRVPSRQRQEGRLGAAVLPKWVGISPAPFGRAAWIADMDVMLAGNVRNPAEVYRADSEIQKASVTIIMSR